MTHIYIGNNIADIEPGQSVAITINKLNIGNLSGRTVNFSNTIKAPWTERNCVLFGYSFLEESLTTVPYTIQQGKVIQNGIVIIPQANILIKKTNTKSFELIILEDVYDYFAQVEGLTIKDIRPFSESAWNAAGIDAARLSTDGVVAVILNWGKSGGLYQYDYFLPCFYYHSLIKSILEYTGLTLSGNILTDASFTDLVIPFPGSEFIYPESLGANVSTLAQRSSTDYTVGITSSTSSLVVWDMIQYGPENWDALTEYEVQRSSTLTIDVSFRITIDTWGDGTFVTVSIAVNGVSTGTDYTLTNPATDSGTQTLSLTDGFSAGDEISLLLETDAPTLDVGVVVKVGSFMSISFDRAVNRDMVSWNDLLPDVNCKDLLSDFFTRFAIIPKQVGSTLYLKTIEEILLNRADSLDWRNVRVNRNNDEIEFDLSYAQNNNFNYRDSEFVKDKNLGLGNMQIANSILGNTKDIFTSIFEKCETGFVGGFKLSTVPVYDTTSTGIDTFANEPGLHLLTLKDRTTESAITFNVTPRTDYKIGYFIDPTLSKDSGWQYFLSINYPTLITALQKNKAPIKDYNLSETEIAEYDPHKMVYDGDGYYLVVKIKNFISGKITRVEQFKVS